MFARVWISGHPSGTIICQCGDPGQAVWFMAWVPYAISHLHDPLFTTRMLAGQGGANLLQSTSYLLPSFLLSPVTWLFGPTASFNVAETLGPVLSGWAMYVAAGRLSSRWLVRAVAAVSYGFCPFLIGSVTYGHLNFVWLYFPPLLFAACQEIFVGRRFRPWSVGSLLGLLVVAQFFTGTEPLLITVFAASLGLLLGFVVAPRTAWERRRRILTAFAVAVGVALVLLAYPLWYLTHGPRRIVGVPWPGDSLFGLPLRATVEPPVGVHLGSGFLQIGGYFGPAGPTGSYLGIWLLVFLGVSLPLMLVLRRRAAWPVLAAGVLAWLCSLGANLMPSLGSSPWWLPWRYLHTWPYLQEIGPPRFALVVAAAAALLLALALDSWLEVLVRGVGRFGRFGRFGRGDGGARGAGAPGGGGGGVGGAGGGGGWGARPAGPVRPTWPLVGNVRRGERVRPRRRYRRRAPACPAIYVSPHDALGRLPGVVRHDGAPPPPDDAGADVSVRLLRRPRCHVLAGR
jgi:hypothetical protein